ncbi:MAG: metalloregulator ArsR/SmtB family transcription factor [Bacilli bacterium]|jgi:ArsR family transcriptional regulator|nr:metalloregulator ArsR/SmtB family transcription factor [Bacilli bacterium]MDY0063870.1 metalloregulator ArsR/SmtB family transcription factor [Bacilli bacterium]
MEKKMAMVFHALGDENRLQIIQLLLQGETCGCTMIHKLSITQPTLSYHLKTLADANIITAHRKGNWKNYHINKEMAKEIISYLEKMQISNQSMECKM